MEDRKSDEETIKVIDRRRFREDADTRSESLELRSGSLEPSSGAGEDSTINSSEPGRVISSGMSPEPKRGQALEINFPAFLMGMYTQTLIFMGEIPHPETNQVNAHLEAAKQNIDILHVIEEKTNGNLSAEEENLFKEILTTLRLQYVKNSKK